ncbi:hypothetical protein AUJ78_01465 [Candidatus Peregrinibacteria bacterium CG1_02_41_10]|nr:MAG: hypothetical protein AUJ78_01465 [Candidatus Peregrinibacteria bacterium CG1_02_41_10]
MSLFKTKTHRFALAVIALTFLCLGWLNWQKWSNVTIVTQAESDAVYMQIAEDAKFLKLVAENSGYTSWEPEVPAGDYFLRVSLDGKNWSAPTDLKVEQVNSLPPRLLALSPRTNLAVRPEELTFTALYDDSVLTVTDLKIAVSAEPTFPVGKTTVLNLTGAKSGEAKSLSYAGLNVGDYFWRISLVKNQITYFSGVESFAVAKDAVSVTIFEDNANEESGVNQPPKQPMLISPANQTKMPFTPNLALNFTAFVADPDTAQEVLTTELKITAGADCTTAQALFTEKREVANGDYAKWQINLQEIANLQVDTPYFWCVRAQDELQKQTWSEVWSFQLATENAADQLQETASAPDAIGLQQVIVLPVANLLYPLFGQIVKQDAGLYFQTRDRGDGYTYEFRILKNGTSCSSENIFYYGSGNSIGLTGSAETGRWELSVNQKAALSDGTYFWCAREIQQLTVAGVVKTMVTNNWSSPSKFVLARQVPVALEGVQGGETTIWKTWDRKNGLACKSTSGDTFNLTNLLDQNLNNLGFVQRNDQAAKIYCDLETPRQISALNLYFNNYTGPYRYNFTINNGELNTGEKIMSQANGWTDISFSAQEVRNFQLEFFRLNGDHFAHVGELKLELINQTPPENQNDNSVPPESVSWKTQGQEGDLKCKSTAEGLSLKNLLNGNLNDFGLIQKSDQEVILDCEFSAPRFLQALNLYFNNYTAPYRYDLKLNNGSYDTGEKVTGGGNAWTEIAFTPQVVNNFQWTVFRVKGDHFAHIGELKIETAPETPPANPLVCEKTGGKDYAVAGTVSGYKITNGVYGSYSLTDNCETGTGLLVEYSCGTERTLVEEKVNCAQALNSSAAYCLLGACKLGESTVTLPLKFNFGPYQDKVGQKDERGYYLGFIEGLEGIKRSRTAEPLDSFVVARPGQKGLWSWKGLVAGRYLATAGMGDSEYSQGPQSLVINGASLADGSVKTATLVNQFYRATSALEVGGDETLHLLLKGGEQTNGVLNTLNVRNYTWNLYLEAESLMTQHDAEQLENVSNSGGKFLKLKTGGSLEQKFKATTNGSYRLFVRPGSLFSGTNAFVIRLDGQVISLRLLPSSTAQQKWLVSPAVLNLGTGEHLLKVEALMNVDLDAFLLTDTGDLNALAVMIPEKGNYEDPSQFLIAPDAPPPPPPVSPDADNDDMLDAWEVRYGFNPQDPSDAREDPDQDDLDNLMEYQKGTHPRVKDTDNDEMSDGWEGRYGFNPLAGYDALEDADSDGYSNLEEYKNGTNPRQKDPPKLTNTGGGYSWRRFLTSLGDKDLDQQALINWLEGQGLSWQEGLGELDSDNDGSINKEEFVQQTNPRQSDTDNDGMSDGWEVNNKLNPRSANDAGFDSDQDGLNNLREFQSKTDPHNADTDQDKMPDGWEAKNKLDPLSGLDAYLDPDGDGLNNLAEYLTGTDPYNPDTDGDGIPDGGAVNLRNQASPNWQDTDKDSLPDNWEEKNGLDSKNSKDKNQDLDQDKLSNYQEFLHRTDPRDSDTDNDGMRDGLEVQWSLSPTDAADAGLDYDQDGLSSKTELLVNGTDPLKADTDGDDFTDGDEVSFYRTNPLDKNSFPQEGQLGLSNFNQEEVVLTNTPFFVGTAPKNSLVKIYLEDSLGEKTLIVSVSADAVGRFMAKSNPIQTEGKYRIVLEAYSHDQLLATSALTVIEVSFAQSLEAPMLLEINGEPLSEENLKKAQQGKKLSWETNNIRPEFKLTIPFGGQIYSLWQSILVSSALIADISQPIKITSPVALEPGSHQVVFYAVYEQGKKSAPLEIDLQVIPRVDAFGVSGLTSLTGSVNPWRTVLLIACLIVFGIVSGLLLKRRKRKGKEQLTIDI